MQPIATTRIQSPNWVNVKRVRVRDTVQHRNAYWSNVTGINSEPVHGSSNWVFIEEAEPYANQLKITKHPNNTGKGLEVNDSVSGYFNTSLYFLFAVYLGGDPTDYSSFDVASEQPL